MQWVLIINFSNAAIVIMSAFREDQFRFCPCQCHHHRAFLLLESCLLLNFSWFVYFYVLMNFDPKYASIAENHNTERVLSKKWIKNSNLKKKVASRSEYHIKISSFAFIQNINY
ncbi:hypothetical protein BGP76_17520 [Reichenbachiella sp. MSK19-1]|nr:hypothetical protein BGP76_17520 [Reichenbachiella sp. MSK19-1]